ncbi:MAG: rhamnulokinase [Christensenellaceae bacterium]|jgi:rhamnulokinase
MKELNLIAFDCGNSSFRTILGRFDGTKIETEVIGQTEHHEVELTGRLYWDVLRMFQGLSDGMRIAAGKCGNISSAGIATWGIDFGIIGEDGRLLSNPLSYRNSLGQRALETLTQQEKDFMYYETGIRDHQMNTVYQMMGLRAESPALFSCAKKCLLMPDLLSYFFTGEMRGERTIASTTQYYSMKTREYSDAVLNKREIEKALLPALIGHGEKIGMLREEIAKAMEITPFPFICVPSHDTACAAAGVPAAGDFAFISSGTWGLIGTEESEPIITQEVYDMQLSNEGGVFGTVTLLKNAAGMFVIQRIRREMNARDGCVYQWDEIVEMAKAAENDSLVLDLDDPRLYNPQSMLRGIREVLAESGQDGSCTDGELIRAVYESMAMAYKYTVEQLETATGKNYPAVHIVGGGAKNSFLNQLAANALQKKVVAGPYEATSMGNMGVQLVYHVEEINTLADVRSVISASVHTKEFEPQAACDVEKYLRYKRLVGKG